MDSLIREARELGQVLVEGVREMKEFPGQIHVLSQMRTYFCTVMEKRRERWDWEYRYWQEKGWL